MTQTPTPLNPAPIRCRSCGALVESYEVWFEGKCPIGGNGHDVTDEEYKWLLKIRQEVKT
jgi:ribosomal protein L37E